MLAALVLGALASCCTGCTVLDGAASTYRRPGGWRPGCEKRKMMDGAWGDMTTMVGWLVEMGWDGIHEGDLEGRGARE